MSDELVRKSRRLRLRLGIPSFDHSRKISSRNYEVSDLDMESFINFLESDEAISKLLENDICYMMSDAYLIASVFSYFQWSGLGGQWNRRDFFALLYLAIEIEEELLECKWELLPYALGDNWDLKRKSFKKRKNSLFQKMDFRGIVSKSTCDQVIQLKPHHPIWKRIRKEDHGGARRAVPETREYFPSGPNKDPLPCIVCGKVAERTIKKPQKVITKTLPGFDVSTDKSPVNKRTIENENFIDADQIKRLRLRGISRTSFIDILVE